MTMPDTRTRCMSMNGMADSSIPKNANRAELKEQSETPHAKVGLHRSTSTYNKCKGKYRINFKGAACHGSACCGAK